MQFSDNGDDAVLPCYRIGPDGTLYLHGVIIPPSGFWSPEFYDFHASAAAATGAEDLSTHPFSRLPARDASEENWAQFDQYLNQLYFAELLKSVRDRFEVEVEDTELAGVHVGIITPKSGIAPCNRNRVLINLHAGGFVFNRGLNVGLLESTPVAATECIKVITIDYRQAPFFTYPAASEDVEAVYRELLRSYSADSIGIYGSSAGGALAAQCIAWFQSKGLPRPGAAGIFNYFPPIAPWPWGPPGDSSLWGQGVLPRAHLSRMDQIGLEAEEWYMEGVAADNREAYPGSSEDVLSRFPATLLMVGTREYWMSPAIVAHAKFLKLGVDSSLYVMEGATHSAHLLALGTPEYEDVHAYVGRWFRKKLA